MIGRLLTAKALIYFPIILLKKDSFAFDRSGSIRAYKVCLLNEPIAEKYNGVVCSVKDNFGFIERSDVVREIFFHYSEYQGDINELILGDDVEFSIQFRNVSAALSLINKSSPLIVKCREALSPINKIFTFNVVFFIG